MSCYKDLKKYDGVKVSDLQHIPQISWYNHNYYVGLKRIYQAQNELLFAHSDDDNETIWYVVGPFEEFKQIGYSLGSEGDIIHFYEEDIT